MAVAPPTPGQLQAATVLITAHRIERVAPDATRSCAFFVGGTDRISQLPLLTNVGVK